MDKQEKILTQGIKFIVRDNSSKNEFEEGLTNHVPFILDVNEIQIRLFRESIQAENGRGADLEIIREDTGFITSKNRFVGVKEAEIIAGLAGQIWVDNGKHNLSSIQFEKSLKTMKESGIDLIKLRFPSSDGYYFIDHIIGNGLKPEDLY